MEDDTKRLAPPRLLSLYIGSKNDAPLMHPLDKGTLIARTAVKFKSFSLFEGKGSFRGKLEEIIRLDIATDNPREVLELAAELVDFLEQDGVGIAYQGFYVRMTREICRNEIAQRRSHHTVALLTFDSLLDELNLLDETDPGKRYQLDH
jgi:hypothetical protein